ncbi:hypothetical protein CC80DRAFT_182400 [Byssothecium circinans]|uniref:Uncharacterized protein n=1 Tax=Byssothecium circinans TaxID=147558 RepID=A0A6A5TI01_9PLEO|nr:hypothetical protein CC80DRAFT_182400 [Byssothecium circinans]
MYLSRVGIHSKLEGADKRVSMLERARGMLALEDGPGGNEMQDAGSDRDSLGMDYVERESAAQQQNHWRREGNGQYGQEDPRRQRQRRGRGLGRRRGSRRCGYALGSSCLRLEVHSALAWPASPMLRHDTPRCQCRCHRCHTTHEDLTICHPFLTSPSAYSTIRP